MNITILSVCCYGAYKYLKFVVGILCQKNRLQWIQQIFANQLSKHLVEIHHRHYIIHYPYGITWYKIILPRRIGPCMIDTVVDHHANNVKKDIFAFMGPTHNFHGLQLTPNVLGYDSLTFTFLDGTFKTFESTDILCI
jgi:hypothetical protein